MGDPSLKPLSLEAIQHLGTASDLLHPEGPSTAEIDHAVVSSTEDEQSRFSRLQNATSPQQQMGRASLQERLVVPYEYNPNIVALLKDKSVTELLAESNILNLNIAAALATKPTAELATTTNNINPNLTLALTTKPTTELVTATNNINPNIIFVLATKPTAELVAASNRLTLNIVRALIFRPTAELVAAHAPAEIHVAILDAQLKAGLSFFRWFSTSPDLFLSDDYLRALVTYVHEHPDANDALQFCAHQAEIFLQRPDMRAFIGTIGTRGISPAAEGSIRLTLGLPPYTPLRPKHAQQAALISFLTPLRQGNVGTCFDTGPCIGVQQQYPEILLKDLRSIIASGYVERTIDGTAIQYPINRSAEPLFQNPDPRTHSSTLACAPLLRTWEHTITRSCFPRVFTDNVEYFEEIFAHLPLSAEEKLWLTVLLSGIIADNKLVVRFDATRDRWQFFKKDSVTGRPTMFIQTASDVKALLTSHDIQPSLLLAGPELADVLAALDRTPNAVLAPLSGGLPNDLLPFLYGLKYQAPEVEVNLPAVDLDVTALESLLESFKHANGTGSRPELASIRLYFGKGDKDFPNMNHVGNLFFKAGTPIAALLENPSEAQHILEAPWNGDLTEAQRSGLFQAARQKRPDLQMPPSTGAKAFCQALLEGLQPNSADYQSILDLCQAEVGTISWGDTNWVDPVSNTPIHYVFAYNPFSTPPSVHIKEQGYSFEPSTDRKKAYLRPRLISRIRIYSPQAPHHSLLDLSA